MNIDPSKYKKLTDGLHYAEGVETDRGENVPEAELHEITLERVDGGFETFQEKKRIQLACKCVDVMATVCRLCLRACCKECRCSGCRKGVCWEHQATVDGKLVCPVCEVVYLEAKHEAEVGAMWNSLRGLFNLGKDKAEGTQGQ